MVEMSFYNLYGIGYTTYIECIKTSEFRNGSVKDAAVMDAVASISWYKPVYVIPLLYRLRDC